MTWANTSADKSTSKTWRTVLVLAFLACALLALSGCSSDADSKGDEAEKAKSYPPPNPLFYELANSDGEVEGWLLGTIHALPEGVVWRTKEIERISAQADFLAVEVASVGQNDEARRAFMELSQSPDLEPLDQRVPPQLRSDLDMMIARLKTSRAILRSSEDWAAAIMLSQVDAPGEPEYGVDRALISQFGDRKVIGFETARSQLGIFDQLDTNDQRALLQGTIKDWASSSGNRDRLLRAWLSGDANALEDATNEGIMAISGVRGALLVKRNIAWMKQLTPMLEDPPKPLIAVGAAHLVGPDGLVTMLENEGYTVKRMGAS